MLILLHPLSTTLMLLLSLLLFTLSLFYSFYVSVQSEDHLWYNYGFIDYKIVHYDMITISVCMSHTAAPSCSEH